MAMGEKSDRRRGMDIVEQIFVAKDVRTKLTRLRAIKGIAAFSNPHKDEKVASSYRSGPDNFQLLRTAGTRSIRLDYKIYSHSLATQDIAVWREMSRVLVSFRRRFYYDGLRNETSLIWWRNLMEDWSCWCEKIFQSYELIGVLYFEEKLKEKLKYDWLFAVWILCLSCCSLHINSTVIVLSK